MASDNNARARTALAQAPRAGASEVAETLQALLSKDSIKRRFEEILGARAAGFISSVITVTNGNAMLKNADPRTVVSAAAIAASLDLPIDPNLGFAYIVPYRDNKTGVTLAQFQLGYRGYVQLGLRTGQYKTIHVGPVYEGEIDPPSAKERLTGEMRFRDGGRTSDKVAGYAAYFRLLNGAEMWDYMTVEEADAHAQRFSKSYNRSSSPWKTDFNAMACKTVLKRLLSHYGILSVQMQTAVLADQAVVREPADGGASEFDYVDTTGDVGDAEPVTEDGRAVDPATGETQPMSAEAQEFFGREKA